MMVCYIKKLILIVIKKTAIVGFDLLAESEGLFYDPVFGEASTDFNPASAIAPAGFFIPQPNAKMEFFDSFSA